MAVKKPEEHSATGEHLENAGGGVSDAALAAASTRIVVTSGSDEEAALAVLREYWSEIDRENATIAAIQKQIDLGWSAIHRNLEEIDAVLRRLQAA